MPPRIVIRRVVVIPRRNSPHAQCSRSFANQNRLTTTKSRPSLPFLFVPTAGPSFVRCFTSARNSWLKHEAKLVARYTFSLWGAIACVVVIFFAINEEMVEREFPTPHEWHYLTRKFLRDANKFRDPHNGEINWARALELSRGVVIRLEDPKLGGQNVIKLSDKVDPKLEVPGEFINCDLSAMSEEWRRGYFEAIMLAAKAAEHVDGWLRDVKRNIVCAPEFVIGPSNLRPSPIPPGNPHAPREEDCELAYPSAEHWYMKILATKGLSPRQKMEAALEYASFMEYKGKMEGSEALYNVALAEATQGLNGPNLPYDPKTFILRDRKESPSMNVLDALTAIATHKARKGDVTGALPIYISLLKARRSLSDEPLRISTSKSKSVALYQQVFNLFAPPEYPPPPPDGALPPWRSAHERCQEASLDLYIGEILYATGSREDGLAWTRDGVDLAEEQLRKSSANVKGGDDKRICRECLVTGLGNWSTMVSRLAKVERAKAESGSKSSLFSFWNSSQKAEDRWVAEEAVVQERTKRTRELLDEVTAPAAGISSWFSA